jgi:excisionase family DNA binding protein
MDHTEVIKSLLTEIIRPIVIDAVETALNNKDNNPRKRYYTSQEAMEHLRISRATFYRLVKKGKIDILKIGNRSLIDADLLDEAVERREIYRYKHY